ncbi:von Willebrand factor type A [Halalkaliarchaeum desulfuricum]|uniref:von Willebrand factor type A n=1 Tax=Halalkaliarchaeum desulfuricum TaxID=2055893 RepID=A0A343TMR3_9EURY|nr:SipW-dependent-type signal peptide-containing protein [Halalkaliarchaeum desulfuricum]AUX10385.1 von Willebrand factor type A [Halalkaliarchaeum desulfuricum]
MSKKNNGLKLSRRKALAGIGAIGAASAGAGMGTSAFFSDQESFEGNSLAAGELQLHGSWQQIYYGASQETRPQDYGAAGRPWVNAFPDDGQFVADADSDGIQSLGDRTYVDDPDVDPKYGDNIQLTCDDFEDLPDAPSPVFDLEDVKPGDKGEATFGLNLCDNPGYLWLQSELADYENNPGTEDHLKDFIKAKVWVDEDCDNVPDGCKDADIMLTVDFSGSTFYDSYGGLVSDDPIEIGGHEYDETTLVDLAEQAIYELIVHLRDDLECEYNVGAVFFSGYDGDSISGEGSGDAKLRVVDPTTDLSGLIEDGDYNTADVPADTGDDPNEGGELRNLRYQLAEIIAHDPDPDDDPDEYVWDPREDVDEEDISTGTALKEGIEEAEDVMEDEFGNQHNVLITDGSPWEDGNLGSDDYEEVLEIAHDARVDDLGPPTSICVIGDTDERDESVYLQQVVANTAGVEIDVDDAMDAINSMMSSDTTLDDHDPMDVGGNLAHWFPIRDDNVATELYVICLSDLLGEYVLGYGTLGDVLDDLNSDGMQLFQTPRLEADACFEPGRTHCIGFKWWFPTGQDDVNDAQGDSLTFDLSFYTEQCRHNENPTGPPADD